ncbi:hypothetical protein P7C70_g9474, partial [Phenoliferia sp. Uapishka_3]
TPSYQYTTVDSLLPRPSPPPPFSFDHIAYAQHKPANFKSPPPSFVGAGSRPVLNTPASSSTAGSEQKYVAPLDRTKTYADVVHSRNQTQSYAASSTSQLIPATIRSGGSSLDLHNTLRCGPFYSLCPLCPEPKSLNPRAQPFVPSTARQPSVASALRSSPFYPTTFESIPNTILANGSVELMDLQDGIDECNTYPRLSDISEMEEDQLIDDEGFARVLSKSERRRSKRIAAMVRNTPSLKLTSTQLTPPPPSQSQREHSYNGKGKQRATYYESDMELDGGGEFSPLSGRSNSSLTSHRRQKRREDRQRQVAPSSIIRSLRARVGELEASIWAKAKAQDGSLKTRADKWKVLSAL